MGEQESRFTFNSEILSLFTLMQVNQREELRSTFFMSVFFFSFVCVCVFLKDIFLCEPWGNNVLSEQVKNNCEVYTLLQSNINIVFGNRKA